MNESGGERRHHVTSEEIRFDETYWLLSWDIRGERPNLDVRAKSKWPRTKWDTKSLTNPCTALPRRRSGSGWWLAPSRQINLSLSLNGQSRDSSARTRNGFLLIPSTPSSIVVAFARDSHAIPPLLWVKLFSHRRASSNCGAHPVLLSCTEHGYAHSRPNV